MIIGILTTDNGAHSATKWAEATSTHIVSIADGISGEKKTSALKLQAAVIDLLVNAHSDVQSGERGRIAADPSVINTMLDAAAHVSIPQLISNIIDAGKSTPWEADMATPAFSEQLDLVLRNHLHTSMHIERSWHADSNPDTPHAQAFRSTYNAGV